MRNGINPEKEIFTSQEATEADPSLLVNKLALINDSRTDKWLKHKFIEEFLTLSQSETTDKIRNSILEYLRYTGKNMSREFFPVLAAFTISKFFGPLHKKFIFMIMDVVIDISGREIPVVSLNNILCRGIDPRILMWTLYGKWFNPRFSFNSTNIFLVDPENESQEDRRMLEQVVEKAARWSNARLYSPDWEKKIVKKIYPAMIPSLLNQWGWIWASVSPSLPAVIERAPYGIYYGSEWERTFFEILLLIRECKYLRQIWRKCHSIRLAQRLVEHKECDADLLFEIISTLIRDCKVEPIIADNRRSAARELIERWHKAHSFSRRFLFLLPESDVLTIKIYRKVVEDTIWKPRMLKTVLKRVRKKRFRKVLISRRRFLLFLRKKKVDVHNKAIRDGFLKRFPQRTIPRLLGLLQWKGRIWNEGKVISSFCPTEGTRERYGLMKFNPSGIEAPVTRNDTPLPAGSLFSFFLALISRNNGELIRKGAEIAGDQVLMTKARDSISIKQRFELFRWAQETLIGNNSLWDQRCHPSNEAEALLLKHLKEYCRDKKVVVSIIDMLSPSPARFAGKSLLTLRIGGCSLKDLKVKASDVSCCYFNGGGYDGNLVPWIISPHHSVFYMQTVRNGERKYIGVVMLFMADHTRTLVIDSVEGKAGIFRQFPGWQEWLISVFKECARKSNIGRIIINRHVNGDLAKKFVEWVEKNEKVEEHPAPVRLPKSRKNISMELCPDDKSSFISLRLI